MIPGDRGYRVVAKMAKATERGCIPLGSASASWSHPEPSCSSCMTLAVVSQPHTEPRRTGWGDSTRLIICLEMESD